MRRCGIELARVCLRQAADIARVLDASRLHAETDSKVRHLPFTRIADRIQHAFDTTLAKASGDEDAVKALKLRLIPFDLKPLGFDPHYAELEVLGQSAMHERFLQRLV